MAPAVFKTVGRARRGGRFDSCLFRMESRSESHLPAVGRLLARQEIAAFVPILSRPLVTRALRETVAELREGMRSGAVSIDAKALVEEEATRSAIQRLEALARRRIRPVLNGTGVILHTNLGRSPLDAEIWDAAKRSNSGYCSIEMDLESGERGRRGGLAPMLAAELAGTESAIILNNNAGAVLLALRAIAAGREVVVSRGEQVQIGGGFRIPEILALSGARLVEVGTTNVTTVDDYLAALTPATACVLLVHGSNFVIRGFASKPRFAELAAALPPTLPIVVDQGSGCWREGIEGETPLSRYAREGAALVCFSGDKLLGGPQAGIAAGRKAIVEAMGRDPLARALRPGKTVQSLLEERLVRLLNGDAGRTERPELSRLEAFGKAVSRILPRGSFALLPSRATTGGGSAPDESFESFALVASGSLAEAAGGVIALASRLRSGEPPLVAIARDGRLAIDLACLCREDAGLVAGVLRAALYPGSGEPARRED